MVTDLIPPTLQVLADFRVTPSELTWYAEELIVILTTVVVMSALWEMLWEASRW